MKKIALLALLFALPLSADLRRDIESKSGWVGYSIPVAEHHWFCSWDGQSHEGSSTMLVLYRVSGGAIETIRLASPECNETESAQWLQNVDPRESAQLLRRLIDEKGAAAKKAVTALALHDGTNDDLIDIARHHESPSIRKAALFWVGQHAGKRAASVLKDAVDNDPEEKVKSTAVFGIAQLPNDQSIPLLIELMKSNRSAAVRKKAAFWLGQKNDPRALDALADILNR
jgi:HEAT repeat protein